MKELTFTKIIMIFISIVWIASLVACFIKPEISFIMDYTNGAFISAVVGYAVKSGAENVVRMNKDTEEPDPE